MSPVPGLQARGNVVQKPTKPNELTVEAWAQGYLVGSLIIMSFITIANMRRGVLLHKLILLELILGLWQGFWLFFNSPVHAWWLSVAAIPLNASWSLHNVIAWMKIKPFLSKNISRLYIITIILAQPYWVMEIYANFTYFHGINDLFLSTRPWEALCRDPWWIVTTVYLFVIIKTQYEISFREITRISPRFAVMLLAMVLSIIFIFLDIFAVTKVLRLGGSTGINPFWKLAFVFKCLTDSVVLDDFKMALDRLRAFKMSRLGSFSADMTDRRNQNNGTLVATWERIERGTKQEQEVHSPDGDYINPSNFPWKPERAHKAHNDSVVSREHVHWRDPGVGVAPEDMVPSAIEDIPMRRIGTSPTHSNSNSQRQYADDLDSLAEGDVEADYADALREVQRESIHSNRRRSDSPRRSPRS